jgi:hypothetical protein
MINDRVKNNLVAISHNKRDYARAENSRLGSVEQRATTYRRGGMLNFHGRQMMNMTDDGQLYRVGVGGPPVVGS